MNIYANYDKNAPSIGESQLLHGHIDIESNDKHQIRIGKYIYSGDIIQLTCCNNSILTYYGNDLSSIMMTPINQQNMITKLRLIMKNKDKNDRALVPLKYLDETNARSFLSLFFMINLNLVIIFC